MTEALIVLAAVCVTLAVALVFVVRIFTEALRFAVSEGVRERRELLERIQRPERVPVQQPAEPVELPEQQADEWNLIGSISIADDYGLGED